MELQSVGQVIATRRINTEGAKEPVYVVNIGLPQKFPESPDFYCPVEITSSSGKGGRIRYSGGIDAIQALQLAMGMIGGVLFRLNEECGGKLRWDGDEKGDLGFPLPDEAS
jgi:hypothetical protein